MKDIINEALMSDDGDNLFNAVIEDINNGINAKESIQQNCDILRNTGIRKNQFIAEVYQVLLEADVQFLNAQIFIISHLIDHPKVVQWGKNNIKNWDELDNSQKVELLFRYMSSINDNNPLSAVRAYMSKSDKVKSGSNPMTYDIIGVDTPNTGDKTKHWEQFKNTEVYKDLRNIFLDSL